jgi:hypothetical protein
VKLGRGLGFALVVIGVGLMAASGLGLDVTIGRRQLRLFHLGWTFVLAGAVLL